MKPLTFALCAAPALMAWPTAAFAADAQTAGEPSASKQAASPNATSLGKGRARRASTEARRVLAGTDGVCIYDNGLPNGVNGYSNGTVNAFGSRRTLLDDFTVPPGGGYAPTACEHRQNGSKNRFDGRSRTGEPCA